MLVFRMRGNPETTTQFARFGGGFREITYGLGDSPEVVQ